ncbi:MAG: alpha/beta fold hydrolase [Myxococcales bacterium]|nr:alpha/beta fold hydrolase [Myxococcales bacterium]
MPAFATVPDPVHGPGSTGRIRYDLRQPAPATGRPPLVLVGGMTQTLASWGGQLRPLSATRPVLAYECRGQGATELDLREADLPRHVEDLVALLEALGLPTPVDLCGFSFGGRVCLAVAATQPALARRLVLSGVSTGRGVVGQLIVEGWLAALRTGDLEALARISLPDIVGPAYLEAHAHLVEPMVRAVVERNSFAGIDALFHQTLRAPSDPAWTNEAMAARVQCPTLVLGGELDRLAPPAEVRDLAERMGARALTIPGAGHTIPIEAAERWREAVLEHLDAP